MRKPISIMIKPSSSKCNMRCAYCFYHDVADNREIADKGFMSVKTLEEVLVKAFEFADGQPVRISFQGGEPLLSGKKFFLEYERIVKKANTAASPVFTGIQTNGTLIDDEWCDFFLRNKVLVGLSIDGTEAVDAYRVDAGGNPTFQKAFAAAKLMQKRGVDFNVLSVLTKKVAHNIEEVYRFFTSNGFKFIQFIPCLKPLGDCTENEFCLSGQDYAEFLEKCFALYLKDFLCGNYTSVRNFDNLVALTGLKRAEQCGMNGHCTHQYVVEGNGDVYPCDFYCLDEYLLGNILQTDFDALEHSRKAIDFIKESMVIEEKCKACRWFALCKNGCKRERTDLDKCEAVKAFFDKNIAYFRLFRQNPNGRN